MTDRIVVGDPMFENSIKTPKHCDFHSRRGDRLLTQVEQLRKELSTTGLTSRERMFKKGILRDAISELKKCGPYYARKAEKIRAAGINVRLNVDELPIPATLKGRKFLEGATKKKTLKN